MTPKSRPACSRSSPKSCRMLESTCVRAKKSYPSKNVATPRNANRRRWYAVSGVFASVGFASTLGSTEGSLLNEPGFGARSARVQAARHATGEERAATGADRLAHRAGHEHRILGLRDGRVQEHAVTTELHRD